MRAVSFSQKIYIEILNSYFESEWKLNDKIVSLNQQHSASYVEKKNYLELIADFCQIKLFPILLEKMLIFNWLTF